MVVESRSRGRRRQAGVHLRLYIAGDASNSVRAKANLASALDGWDEPSVTLEVIDVWLEPERAMADGVIVTPMLIRLSPAPARKVIGDLSDACVIRALFEEVAGE